MDENWMPFKINSESRQADFFDVCEKCLLGCCNGARPPLTSKRKSIIQKFLNANGLRVSNPFENRDYTFPKETEDGYCIFLDKTTKKCRIHPAKPETCVAGPITFDINLETGEIEWFLKTDKICQLASSLYKDKEAFEKHLRSAKREILTLVRDLEAKALRAILTIKEPDTFRIGEDALDSKVIAKLKP